MEFSHVADAFKHTLIGLQGKSGKQVVQYACQQCWVQAHHTTREPQRNIYGHGRVLRAHLNFLNFLAPLCLAPVEKVATGDGACTCVSAGAAVERASRLDADNIFTAAKRCR
eukprot:1143393-Pelagomonas_calceolata.AAC.4